MSDEDCVAPRVGLTMTRRPETSPVDAQCTSELIERTDVLDIDSTGREQK
jgi:hypothetical protein